MNAQFAEVLHAVSNVKKPSKKQAQEIMRRMMERYLSDEDPRAVNDFAKLYSFFMPARPAKAKEGFKWVAQAAGKRGPRHYLNYVYVDERHITATDGYRAHRLDNAEGLEPGFYLTNGDKAHDPEYAKYPDVDRVLPPMSGPGRKVHTVKTAELRIIESNGMHTYALPCEGGNVWVNKKYLDQATAGHSEFKVSTTTPEASVRIEVDGEKAIVIMPIRQK